MIPAPRETFDVALVRPWSPAAVPADSLVEDSLATGYLAAQLRAHGFTVAVIDAFALALDDAGTALCVAALRPRLVGISLHSFSDYRHFVEISQRLKALAPDAYQVAGGEHASFLAREILNEVPSVDAVVTGEGELTILDLAGAVRDGGRGVRIPGCLLRGPGETFIDGGYRHGVEDLDDLPRPHKDTVELGLRMGRSVAVSILSGRGCTHKCTFCTANTYLRLGGGNTWRRRRAERVADEFEWLAKTYIGQPNVHPMIQFQDVIFLGTSRRSVEWTETFVGELERRGLTVPFYFMARADAILRNAHLLDRLARSGLASVEVGIETGVDRILAAYNKRNSKDQTVEAIRLLNQNAICYDASGFIMFDPDVTLEELRENAAFLRTIGHATWDRYVTRLQIFPGTAIKAQFLSAGRLDPAAPLDDVYGYAFADSRVALLSQYARMYDTTVHELNNLVRAARSVLAGDRRSGAVDAQLDLESGAVQDLFRDHFLDLCNLVDRGASPAEADALISRFLAQAATARMRLGALLARRGPGAEPMTIAI